MRSHHLLPLLLLCILFLAQCTKEEDTSPAENLMQEASKISYTYPALSTEPMQKASTLTAAEWNDLANWQLWTPQLKLGAGRLVQEKWHFALQHRYTVVLTDSLHKRIADARITLETSQGTLLDESRTDNNGISYLFLTAPTKPEDLRLKIVYADQVFYIGDLNPQNGRIEKQLNIQRNVSPVMDILFVANTSLATGDKLVYLQKELKELVNKTKSQADSTLHIRLGSIFYGLHAGNSIIRTHPFILQPEPTLLTFTKPYTTVTHSPEAIDLALEEAIYRQAWTKNASSRLLFLLVDMPFLQDPGTITRLSSLSREAARQGIRIIPVSMGSMNLSGELLLRSLAIRTNGTYIFVTHPEEGLSNPLSTISTYTDEPLNNLMLRLLVKNSKLN